MRQEGRDAGKDPVYTAQESVSVDKSFSSKNRTDEVMGGGGTAVGVTKFSDGSINVGGGGGSGASLRLKGQTIISGGLGGGGGVTFEKDGTVRGGIGGGGGGTVKGGKSLQFGEGYDF